MQAVLEKDQKASLEITFEPFQSGFIESKARYPAFVAGWGTGKTMCAIAKGLELSDRHSGNLGLIARKKFTDLRDSTMKDFTRYTGLHIPQTTKEVTIPGTNSTIMFRHAEELSGLQNVNLGWFYLEQAEEFDTDEQFQLLRGRLRREGCFRQGMIIGNALGHNWIWKLWKKNINNNPEFELFEAKTYDNIRNLPKDFIADLQTMAKESPRKYNRFVMNSWEDYEVEGAYYAALMSDALKEGRVDIQNLCEKGQPVYTAWDLGTRASDTTVIWCFQLIKDQLCFIDYYENYGEGMEHYNNWLNNQNYNFIEHFLPQDSKSAQQGKKIERRHQILQGYRKTKHESVTLVEPHNVEFRIAEVRRILHKCRFDSKCEVGVEGLNRYKAKRNEILSTENKPKFGPNPLDDWSTNPSDSFGYAILAYCYQIKVNGQLIGYPHPISTQRRLKKGKSAYGRRHVFHRR